MYALFFRLILISPHTQAARDNEITTTDNKKALSAPARAQSQLYTLRHRLTPRKLGPENHAAGRVLPGSAVL